jgi:ABC-type transporter Mla subunit MlaD
VIRRVAVLGVVVLAAVAAGLTAIGASGPGPDPYRVDAIFDNADFLVAGQDVKIAGAVEGRVKDVKLARGSRYRARVQLEIHRNFAPFHTDASCSIRPQSLIGEKFVDCDPGTPSGKPLPDGESGVPEIAIERNHSPVDLDLVFATLRLPYRQRLTILVNELGVGLAGRPKELNAAIRRANPALRRANRVLSILDSERRTLGHLIDASDEVIAELAAKRGDVRGFIDRADRVAAAVSSRRGDLDLAIRRLPPMLDELEPAATDLAAFATDARPVANDLRVAARPFGRLLGDFGPLTEAARPTLVALDDLSTTGRRAIRSATPVANTLLPIARRLPEVAGLARDLTASMQARGVPEGLLTFLHLGAIAASRFDRFSHILPSYQISGTCQVYMEVALTDECDAHYGGPRPAARSRRVSKRSRLLERERSVRQRPDPQSPAGRGPRAANPSAPPQPAAAPTPTVPQLPAVPLPALDYLLAP